MTEPNKDLLLHKILHSRDLTAVEKRYLEKLVTADNSDKKRNKVGHWITHANGTQTLYKCSECNNWFPIAGSRCPCGAKMEGVTTNA